MSDRKVQSWQCPKCGKSGQVKHEPAADVMSVVDLIARDHKRSSPQCKQPMRRIRVARGTEGGMKIAAGAPPLYNSFPNMLLLGGELHLRMGVHNPAWKLKSGEKVRFNKHGAFLVMDVTPSVAFVEVTIPRKGWNPEGTRRCLVAVPRQCLATVVRGQLYLERIGDVTWESIEQAALPIRQRSGYVPPLHRHGWPSGGKAAQ